MFAVSLIQFIQTDHPINVDTIGIAHFSDKLDDEPFLHYSRKCICERALFQNVFVAA